MLKLRFAGVRSLERVEFTGCWAGWVAGVSPAQRRWGCLPGGAGCRVGSKPDAAVPAAVPGFSHVKSLGGIDEYRLDSNGLTVLLVPGSFGAGGDVSSDLPGRLAQ